MSRTVWIISIVGVGLVLIAIIRRLLVNATDVEAMARMIASENPRDSVVVQTAVAWAVKNEAKRLNRTVRQLIIPDGADYGSQGTGGRWYVSTANPATEVTRIIARDVMTGAVSDPTGGATNFDSPRSQRAGLKVGKPGYKSTPEQVAEKRIAAGMEMVTLPGVDSDYMRFWRYV